MKIKAKKYMAFLSQSGNDSPTVREIKNELGSISITRNSVGVYLLSCVRSAFLANTVVNVGTHPITVPATYGSSVTTTELMALSTFNASGVLADGLLDNTFIEITVYLE